MVLHVEQFDVVVVEEEAAGEEEVPVGLDSGEEDREEGRFNTRGRSLAVNDKEIK